MKKNTSKSFDLKSNNEKNPFIYMILSKHTRKESKHIAELFNIFSW